MGCAIYKQEEDGGTIIFLVKENLTNQERVTNIVVSHPKANRIEYKLRQLPYFITPSHTELIASYSMSNNSYLYVDSDAEWFIENNNEWMRVSRFPDNNGHIIQIQVDNNVNRNDRNASFSLVSRKNSNIYKNIKISQYSKYYLGEEYVDLGLPSGTLWAVKNIGASEISNLGLRFAWGETETKETFNSYNYRFYDTDNKQYSKYVMEEKFGKVDSLMVLQTADDAATHFWGGNWRIPTNSEVSELAEYVLEDR